jgi:hypothetical protein
MVFMLEQNLWSISQEERLNQIPYEIEDLKVELFNATFRSIDKEKFRERITLLRSEFETLYKQRHRFDHLTATGVASLAKTKYITGCSLRKNGKRILKGNWWTKSENLIDRCLYFISENRITDIQFRELSRSEPWRSYWTARRSGIKLFNNKFFTDEQLSLVTWTGVYDNIYKHPECPSNTVIEDDDALDGWMIVQKRKRKEDENKRGVDQLIKNPKIKNSQEIFIVAQTPQDAAKIDSLNNAAAAIAKAQKFATVKQKGIVDEVNMPDVRLRVQMEMNNLNAEKVRSFRG